MTTNIEKIKGMIVENALKSKQLHELLERTRQDYVLESCTIIRDNVDVFLELVPEHIYMGEFGCNDEKISPASRCLRCALLHIKEHGEMAIRFTLHMAVMHIE